MIKAGTFAAAALLALQGCNSQDKDAKTGVTVEHAWVRVPPVAGRPGAAYFLLHNQGPATVLTGISSPGAERIELHDSQMHDGMMHMAPLADVTLPEGGTVEFKPGGKHAMVFGVAGTLKAGGAIPLTFSLRDGRTIETQAALVAAGDPPPHDH